MLSAYVVFCFLRNLLDDTNFQYALVLSQEESLPYFSQLSTDVPASVKGSHIIPEVYLGETPTPLETDDEKREEIQEERPGLEEDQTDEEGSEGTTQDLRTLATLDTLPRGTPDQAIQHQLSYEHDLQEKIKR